MIARCAFPVIQSALTAPLQVPDALLRLKIAECADDLDLDAVALRIGLHRQEWLQHVYVQCRAEVISLNQVGTCAARELKIVQHAQIVNCARKFSVILSLIKKAGMRDGLLF